jgi:energy-coupling factor transport system permease protein
MRLIAPLEPRPSAPLARAHPLPKLAAAAVLMLVLFVTVDLVTAAIVIAALAAAFPLTGLPAGPFARRLAPLGAAAVGIAAFNTLFAAEPRGAVAGVAAALRLVGISVAGVMTVATIDPTDLADALVQHARAPRRFVLGALAAWRLAPLFGQEWQVLALARRTRGIEADRGLAQRLAAFPGMTFALLVGAIRRATGLALAMDARGFGRRPCRTPARPRRIVLGDWAVLAGSVAVGVVATAMSIALGTWRPLLVL